MEKEKEQSVSCFTKLFRDLGYAFYSNFAHNDINDKIENK